MKGKDVDSIDPTVESHGAGKVEVGHCRLRSDLSKRTGRSCAPFFPQ
jgi:hypothetical protein